MRGPQGRVRFNRRQRRDRVIAKAAAATVATVIVAGGVGGVGPSACASVADITAGRDNTLYEPEIAGLVSNGAGDAFFAGKTANGSIRRGLVRFDLQAALPSNAVVNSASVSMYSTKASLPSAVFLHRALADWGEGTSNAGPTGGQGTTPTTNDVTWQHRFYNTDLWSVAGGDFAVSASATTNNVFIGAFSFTGAPQLNADVQGWINNPASNFGWAVLGDETGTATTKRIASRENSEAGNRPQLHVDYSASRWKTGPGGGAWSAAGNWDFGVPDAVGAEANFSFVAPDPAAVIPVNVDGPKLVGTLNFTSSNAYVLSGVGPLTLDRAVGGNTISVTSGPQRIEAPLRLNRSSDITIAAAASLTAADLSASAGVSIDKKGGGTLAVNQVRLASLTVSDGRVTIIPSGGASSGTSTLNSLLIAAAARLDLGDNKLITNTAPGASSGGVYGGLQGEVQRAYDFGAWDQPGLTTSMPDALAGLTTIGIATGEQVRGLGPSDTDTFAGQVISGASTIAMYTYAGDANLDGTIDGGDYGIIDNFVQVPSADGYANGDFNYDGVIDGGDYGIIDNNIQAQGAPFPTGMAASSSGVVTAVPEPAATEGAVALVAVLLGGPRRRREAVRRG